MIHKFELCERFFVYDEQSGALSEISQVAFELLEYINSAMESPDVPSAVRYSMAKYDSALVKKEYEKLYALQNEGKLFSEAVLPGGICAGDDDAEPDAVFSFGDEGFFDEVVRLADEGKNRILALPDGVTEDGVLDIIGNYEKMAEEVVFRAFDGCPFTFVPFEMKTDENNSNCPDCWARRYCCTHDSGSVLCELEKKRVECALWVQNELKNM